MSYPVFSEPVIGCPPIKLYLSPSSSAFLCIFPLTLPTSVIIHSLEIYGASISRYFSLARTGAHKNITSHAEKSVSDVLVSDSTPSFFAISSLGCGFVP